jgi:hypothetical protein
MSGLTESLAQVTPEQMADELEAHAAKWRFDQVYGRIDHVPLLVITADDRYTASDDALVSALQARHAPVTAVHLDTDHVYSDHRIALQAALIGWLQSLPQ